MHCRTSTITHLSSCRRVGHARNAIARSNCSPGSAVSERPLSVQRTKVNQPEQFHLPRLVQDARQAVLIGMVFLILVNGLAEILQPTFAGRFVSGLANGLEIIGWVALWQPAELLLSEWVPVYRRLRTTQRVADASAECAAA